MNDIFFYKNFCFNHLVFHKHKYTDNHAGSPFHYLAYMIKGHSRIVSDNITIEISPGDLFYIPKGLPYQSYWDSEDDIQFLSFGFHFFPEAQTKHFFLQTIPCDDRLKEEITAIPIRSHTDSFVIGAFYSVLSKVTVLLQYDRKSSKKGIAEIASWYIYEHINCNVSDLANYCLMSKSALYLTFQKEVKLTPNELIQKIKCKKAESLLVTTDKSVQEISDLLNFSSTSYFRKILKLHTGKNPREIRSEAKQI